MGISIECWRMRIGSFQSKIHCKTKSKPSSPPTCRLDYAYYGHDGPEANISFSSRHSSSRHITCYPILSSKIGQVVAVLVVFTTLLVIGGVETNPGPTVQASTVSVRVTPPDTTDNQHEVQHHHDQTTEPTYASSSTSSFMTMNMSVPPTHANPVVILEVSVNSFFFFIN